VATLTPIALAIDRVVGVLQQRPAGLFTDIDGTISPVARVPSEAFIAESARDSLRALGTTLSIVGPLPVEARKTRPECSVSMERWSLAITDTNVYRPASD
jgi:hypothetical protein